MPLSQVAREAIEARLGWEGEGLRRLPFFGIGDSGHSDISQRFDEILTEEWADAILGDR